MIRHKQWPERELAETVVKEIRRATRERSSAEKDIRIVGLLREGYCWRMGWSD